MNLKNVEKVLFLDIETVPQYEKLSEAPEMMRDLFVKRFKKELSESLEHALSVEEGQDIREKFWHEKASLQPEFGKIVCISVGMMYNGKFVKKSFASDDETKLLNDFVNGKLAEKLNDISGGVIFCAYNGDSFDYPFIAKRLIVNGLMVPKIFFYPKLKPWERSFFVDLMSIWKWDVYNSSVSLKLLSYSLGVNDGSCDVDGSMVKDIYYREKDMKKITEYCENDVQLLYNSYVKLYANFANA